MPNEDAAPRKVAIEQEDLDAIITALKECSERPDVTDETKSALDEIIVSLTCFSGGTNPPTPC